MKKYLLASVAIALVCVSGFAQDINQVEQFEVGPYIVDYWGKGDIDFRLKDGIDLFDYFELKKDTVTVIVEKPVIVSDPVEEVKYALWGGVNFTPRGGTSQILFAPQAGIKLRVAKSLYLNAGMMAGLMINRNNSTQELTGKAIIMAAIPVTAEWTKLERGKASMFLELGGAPLLYLKATGAVAGESGISLAPKGTVGAYIPFGKHFLKLGANAMLALFDSGDLSQSIGRTYIGYSLDFVF